MKLIEPTPEPTRDRALELKAWLEWKRECAAERCGADHAEALYQESNRVFRIMMFKRFSDCKIEQAEVEGTLIRISNDYIWHIFEDYSLRKKYTDQIAERHGKSYKEGMFSNIADAAERNGRGVRAGDFWAYFTVMLRSEMKNVLFINEQERGKREKTSSLNQEINDGLKLEDLLPGDAVLPDELSADLDIGETAASLAAQFFDSLDNRKLCFMLAMALELPKSHPALLEAMGVKHATAAEEPMRIEKMVMDFVAQHRPKDDAESQSRLALALVKKVYPMIFSWAQAEKSCAGILKAAEDRQMSSSTEDVN